MSTFEYTVYSGRLNLKGRYINLTTATFFCCNVSICVPTSRFMEQNLKASEVLSFC